MNLFKKSEEEIEELNQYSKDKVMAREVISRWGEKIKLFGCDLGSYYNEYVFSENNLELVYSEKDGLFIIYNEEKVLGYDNQYSDDSKIIGSKVYVPGPWEYQLKELYTKVLGATKKKNDNESLYDKGLGALRLADSLGRCVINDSLRIERDDIRLSDNSISITYNVYKDDELVLSGSFLTSNRDKVYVYEPGGWEEEIKDYVRTLVVRRENLKKEEAKKLQLKK